MTTFFVGEDRAGQRLDALLHGAGGDAGPLSRHQARQLCAIGAVAVDGVRAEQAARVRAGQEVSYQAAHACLSLALGVPVVHADDAIVIVHKPPGLAVHGGPLVDTALSDALAEVLPGSGLAHRLDRDASGLLLIGRHAEALAALGSAMERGDVTRVYAAVVHGIVEADERTIDLPLRVTDEPRGDRPKTVVDPDGQRAVSHVTVRDRRKDATLVEVALETGRTHQIRAHLAAVGHPLLGDPRYGDPAANERARATFGVHRTLLHGLRLRLPHPIDGTEVSVTAAQEPDFAALFPRLRRR